MLQQFERNRKTSMADRAEKLKLFRLEELLLLVAWLVVYVIRETRGTAAIVGRPVAWKKREKERDNI